MSTYIRDQWGNLHMVEGAAPAALGGTVLSESAYIGEMGALTGYAAATAAAREALAQMDRLSVAAALATKRQAGLAKLAAVAGLTAEESQALFGVKPDDGGGGR